MIAELTSIARTGLAIIRSTHPGPSLAVTALCVLFCFGLGVELLQSALVGLAILFQQFSVGLSNDWLDSERDRAVNRKDKPAALGAISAKVVRNASLVAAVLALLAASMISLLALALMVSMLAVGWAYNLGLKASWLSALPYAVGFGLLPIFVSLAAPPVEFPEIWFITVAALLGVSAHFANALPDLFDDKATGVRALPHLLGQRLSAAIIAITGITASVITLGEATNVQPVMSAFGFVLAVTAVLASSVLAMMTRPPRMIFPLMILASLVNVALVVLGLIAKRG